MTLAGRKRPRTSLSATRDDEASDSDRQSPHLIRVKEEQDHDMLDPSPPPQSRVIEPRGQDSAGAPPPSSLHPPASKKRRVTISGAPHPGPLNTDVRVPADQPSSTPISPVVMGFTIMRDNPTAIEQVRSMITVKQKQKALIEQRRGSVAAISPVASNSIPSSLASIEDRPITAAKAPASARSLRRSPNLASGPGSGRRPPSASVQGGVNTRPPSPSPIIVPSQQPMQVPSQAPAHSLPPPPISFARRRAGQLGTGKKKPADIVISPREAHTKEQLQPVIQSAPPVPHAGQGTFYTGRFPMALPRLPSVMGGGDNVRRVATGNVPPTPTRLSMQRNVSTTSHISQPLPGISGRSPPAASVPIAATLVPPTPSSLHHPGYSGDKSAFLAPFEVFYDALNDSKQLKNWLGEQLQRSNTLMQTLTQQQEKLNEIVESLVEKKVGGMRIEVASLHRRIEELEDALRVATLSRRQSTDILVGAKTKGKQPIRNGVPTVPVAPETYTFPPVPPVEPSLRVRPEPLRRLSSPGWGQDRETRENQSMPENENGSPVPYDARRLSVSATRLDPPRSQLGEGSSQQSRNSFVVQSPPQGFRDGPSQALPSSSTHGKLSRSSHSERPGQHQQHAHPRMGGPRYQSDSTGDGKPSGERGSPPPRRGDSRRNSVVMSPIEGHGSAIDGS